MSENTSNIDVYSDGTLTFNGNNYRCALGKNGVVSVDAAKEGGWATPEGTYPLRMLYYRPDKLEGQPQTSLEIRALTQQDGWCDDVNDPKHYNTYVTLPHAGSHEELWRPNDDLYDLIVPLGYNDDPVAIGKGSAIFMHVARPEFTPTAGCVALSKSDLLKVLSEVSPDTKVTIHREPLGK